MGRSRKKQTRRVPLWLRFFAIGVIFVSVLLPICLVLDIFSGWKDSRSLSGWKTLVPLGFTSVGLALSVTVVASVIGITLAWLTTRTDLPGRRIWQSVLSMPIVIPSYVAALAMISAWSPRGPLAFLHGGLYGFGGALLVLSLLTFPYIMLPVSVALRNLDVGWEEAGMTLGKGRWACFFRIYLPLLLPSLISGALIVALYTLSDFGAVAMLHCDTFTRVIYQSKDNFDISQTAIFSLVLLLIVAAIISTEAISQRRIPKHFASRKMSVDRGTDLALGWLKIPSLLWCSLIAFLSLILPLWMLVKGVWGQTGKIWQKESAMIFDAVGNSLVAAGLAACAALLVALPLAYLAGRYKSRLGNVVDRITLTGFGLPGIVVALALVSLAAGYLPNLYGLIPFGLGSYLPTLYQTLPLLVIAYVIQFLPQATGCVKSSLLQMPAGLFEAALQLGTSRRDAFLKVTLPLLVPALLTGWSLVFLTSMRELPSSLILSPNGFSTLTTRIWDRWEEAHVSEASFYSLILVITTSIPLFWLRLFLRRRHEATNP